MQNMILHVLEWLTLALISPSYFENSFILLAVGLQKLVVCFIQEDIRVPDLNFLNKKRL